MFYVVACMEVKLPLEGNFTAEVLTQLTGYDELATSELVNGAGALRWDELMKITKHCGIEIDSLRFAPAVNQDMAESLMV